MAATIPAEQREAFYEVAVLGLKALDTLRNTRPRFDPNADATWAAFKGEQQDADRIDLLVRDAAVIQPAAFAPRVVFGLPGLADDDPFGAGWPGATERFAKGWLLAVPPNDAAQLLRRAAEVWGTQVAAPGEPVGPITPSTRLLVAGLGALLAVFTAFDGQQGFDFAEQVTVVADQPAERQLAGLACALLGGHQAVRLLPADATPDAVAELRLSRAVVSSDVSPAVRSALAAWRQGGLG